jgi:hypothetical protein
VTTGAGRYPSRDTRPARTCRIPAKAASPQGAPTLRDPGARTPGVRRGIPRPGTLPGPAARGVCTLRMIRT